MPEKDRGERASSPNAYILGHENTELDRLIAQASFLGDLTEHFLRRAGIEEGMRVLDVGSGAGDVAFVTARLVGPAGAVLGIDRSPDSVDLASRRAERAGAGNVTFLQGDIGEFTSTTRVDAIVGRLVLMYLPDPAAVVRRLTALVRPGGIITFQEFDFDGVRTDPRCPLVELAVDRLRETFTRAGADIRMGVKLGRVFEDAGLPTPTMLLGARVERGHDAMTYEQIAEITRSLLLLMERTQVATAEAVAVDTLAARLREEAVALRATLVSPSLIAAWTRTSTRTLSP
jgi:SAM-dependent methyltransferase